MNKWDGKSKGNVLGYRIFVFFIKTTGLSFTYFVLRFVTHYYYLFAGDKRRQLIRFYQESLGLPEKKAKHTARKNFYLFGQTLVDRVAFLLGKQNKFSYDFDGEEYLLDLKKKARVGFSLAPISATGKLRATC